MYGTTLISALSLRFLRVRMVIQSLEELFFA
ncbi:unnamed protein product, partial [marine sediment metagenome]